MAEKALGIWEKVDFDRASAAPATKGTESSRAVDAAKWKSFWRSRRPILDVVGSLFWLYAILKVLFVDIDREVIGDLSDYRVFAFLAVLVGLALLLRRPWPFVAGVAYVVAFPLVIMLWKLPKWLYKLRSPGAFLATGNAIAVVFGDVRHSVFTLAVAAFTTLTIAVTRNDVLLTIAATIIAALVLQAIWRTIRFSVLPSRFLRMQQNAIRWVVDGSFAQALTMPVAELKSAEVQKFSEAQQNTFLQNLGWAVIAHRAINFWAYQLENYRRGPATLFFNALSYFWLLLRALVGLALMDFALYRADASAFEYEQPPGFLVFIRYVIAGVYGGEIEALRPGNDLASALSIATFVIGLVVVGSLLLSSALSFRAARDRSEMQETIVEIKRQGDRLDERVRQEYEVSVEEAVARLEELQYGLMGLINFFSTRLPRGPEPSP